jgi:hypothetical protein
MLFAADRCGILKRFMGEIMAVRRYFLLVEAGRADGVAIRTMTLVK